MGGVEAVSDVLLFLGALTLVKSLLVVAGAFVCSRLLAKGPAAARHALWTGTLVVLLALPFSTLLPGTVPTIPVPGLSVLPGASAAAAKQAVRYGDPRTDLRMHVRDDHPGLGAREHRATRTEADPDDSGAFGGPGVFGAEDGPAAFGAEVGSGAAGARWGVTGPATPSTELPAAAAGAPSRIGESGAPGAPGAGMLLAIGWLLGALLLLLPVGVGLRRGRRMIRWARPLSSPDWVAAVDRARARVGVRRRVGARIAPGTSSAMAGGMVHPVVLFPEHAPGWSPERRDLVLIHELVHIRRADPARQILGRVVLALHWFNPLVWWVVRRAAEAREEACDERVLELGSRPSTYAEHLLDLAGTTRATPVGLTGFHHPDLESRLMAILNHSAPPRSRRAGAFVGLFGLLWVGTVACLGPAMAEPPVPQARTAAEAYVPPAPPTPDGADVRSPAPPAPMPAEARPAPPPAPATPAVVSAPAPFPGPRPDAVTRAAPRPDPAASPVPPVRVEVAAPPPPPIDPCPREGPRADAAQWSGYFGEDIRVVTRDLDGFSVCLDARGDIRWSDDRSRIESLGEGASVVLSIADEVGSQRLELVPSNGGIAETWRVNGVERPVTPEVLEWRDAVLAYLGAHAERASILGERARLRGEIARIRGEEARMRGSVARIQGEEARIRGERARIVGEEARLRGEIARIRGEEARIRAEAVRTGSRESGDHAARVRAMEARIEAVRAEIEALGTADRLEQVDAALRSHRVDSEGRVEAVKAELDRHTAEAGVRIREIEARIETLDTASRVEALDARIEVLEDRVLDAVRRIGFPGGSL